MAQFILVMPKLSAQNRNCIALANESSTFSVYHGNAPSSNKQLPPYKHLSGKVQNFSSSDNGEFNLLKSRPHGSHSSGRVSSFDGMLGN